MKILITAAIACLMLHVSGQATNINDALTTNGLTALNTALTDSNLMATLDGLAAVTIFAPTDDAFTAAGTLPTGNDLVSRLQYHVIAESIQSSAITNNLIKPTVNGADLRLNKYENNPTVYTAQGAIIKTADVQIPNGYIHIVKSVLTVSQHNVFELVSNTTSFSSLKTAIDSAGLQSALEAVGPLTVFAPNNSATELDTLDTTNTTTLKAILKYHVVSGAYFRAGLKNNQEVTTLQGDKLKIIIDGGNIYINSKESAMVIDADVHVTNGVIHTINEVLNPDDNDNTSGATSMTCSVKTAFIVAFLAIVSVCRLG